MELGGPQLIRVTPDERKADDWSLVLSSAGIVHRVDQGEIGWQLLVDPNDGDVALQAIESFERENRSAASPTVDETAPFAGSRAGLLVAAFILSFHFLLVEGGARAAWLTAGRAEASRILAGEWWRTITALTLHADASHVVGNAVSCAIFVTVLSEWLGAGLAGVVVLLSGALGNSITAYIHGSHFSSIGASTALFGAIGALGGVQAVRRRRLELGGRRAWWVAIGASVGLLAMLGTGKETDLLAHLFGFSTGLGLGVAAALAARRPVRGAGQVVLGLAAIATVVGSWWIALRPLR